MSSSNSSSSLTQPQIQFTNAFNRHRHTLTAFSTCFSKEELDIVRDGFYLGLASELCPEEYDPVRFAIVTNSQVADATKTNETLRLTVEAARKSNAWDLCVESLKMKACLVGSDLDSIWMTLECGRLEWLAALSSAHTIKQTLQGALLKDAEKYGKASEGDISDAKMVYIYALSLSIPALADAAKTWQGLVQMKDKTMPLKDYNPTLWDCRKDEWKALDLGVQSAAERGGSSFEEAWNA
mmetsp:Transcript_33604/g.44829  ORF Transcript_33604/g.44829 Transcript_33604/m.44829 type:complete len:239 (-) Transcript_33604:439-1155(-)